jgi:hypothetical protein
MKHSHTIAALIGPLFCAMAVSLLLNRSLVPVMAQQIGHDYGLIFLSGALLLVAGLAIVRAHNVWSGGWPVLITAIGWFAIVGGLARILFFRQLADIASSVVSAPVLVPLVAGGLLAIGAFLTLKGYRPTD